VASLIVMRRPPRTFPASLAALVLLWLGGHASAPSIAAAPAVASAAQSSPTRYSRPGEPADQEVRALIRLVNQRRVAIGCRPLVWDPRLAEVARRHSQAMARQGFFSHVDRAGNDPFDR